MMKTILKLEEASLFLLSLYVFTQMDFAWWYFPALLLVPDFSMLGYLMGSRVGAASYNFFHHKGLAVVVGVYGYATGDAAIMLAGVILIAHSSMDRVFDYGLKYATGFQDTHLGRIGREAAS